MEQEIINDYKTKLFIRFLKDRNEHKEFNERVKEFLNGSLINPKYISKYKTATV